MIFQITELIDGGLLTYSRNYGGQYDNLYTSAYVPLVVKVPRGMTSFSEIEDGQFVADLKVVNPGDPQRRKWQLHIREVADVRASRKRKVFIERENGSPSTTWWRHDKSTDLPSRDNPIVVSDGKTSYRLFCECTTEQPDEEFDETYDWQDEELLGESTLAKLREML